MKWPNHQATFTRNQLIVQIMARLPELSIEKLNALAVLVNE